MHRRTFLRTFFTLPLATIFIPKIFIFPPIKKLSDSEIIELELQRIAPKIRTLYEVDDTFYRNIEKEQVRISSRDMRIPLKLKPGWR